MIGYDVYESQNPIVDLTGVLIVILSTTTGAGARRNRYIPNRVRRCSPMGEVGESPILLSHPKNSDADTASTSMNAQYTDCQCEVRPGLSALVKRYGLLHANLVRS